MTGATSLRGLSRGVRWALIGGVLLLLSAFGGAPWFYGLVGVALLGGAGWRLYTANRSPRELDPWPWPPDLRAAAEAMARPIDPTPKRILPPDEKSSIIAAVTTTDDGLKRLITDKPPAWPWAVFTSVLLQRRNAVATRLRHVVSGYQPRPGVTPLTGQGYSQVAYRTMNAIADLVAQLEQFMLSPAFTGALRFDDEANSDPDAIVGIANRLMDYHDGFLVHAETCLQTPVEPDVRVFVQDMNAFTLCPLVGYQQFITTMCARIGEAQDLLPYTKGGDVVALDDANLTMSLPDGLTDRILAQIKRFTSS